MVELKKMNNGKFKKMQQMAENFRSVSFGEMLQPKMDCRHTAKSVVIFMPKTVRKLRGGGNLKKIYSNSELARFSPRELITELKARGYTGELKYTQTISL